MKRDCRCDAGCCTQWLITPYKDHTMIGKLYVTHDVGRQTHSGPEGYPSSYQDNIVINHLHRISYMVGECSVFRMWRRVLGGWGMCGK